eukprot:6211761-Pyramimonas_sp.AAC.1
MDRCIRLAAGQEIPDRERDFILDAYNYCWIAYLGPFKVLYSDGEGALKNETAKAMMANKGATRRIQSLASTRPRSSHATAFIGAL